LFGEIRRKLGAIFHELARQKECRIVEGHVMTDHIHMCIERPPKHSVATVIGFIKGKSAIAIARQFSGRDRNFTGEHFQGGEPQIWFIRELTSGLTLSSAGWLSKTRRLSRPSSERSKSWSGRFSRCSMTNKRA
jgi:hypothetical protein